MRIGIYAYRVQQDYANNNCFLQFMCGIFTGVLCIVLRVPISNLFDITSEQKELLQQVLIVFGVSCPIEAVARFLQTYIIYKCYNKLVLINNILSCIVAAVTDWLALELGFGVVGIVAATEMTWFIYGVIAYFCCRFYRVTDKIDAKQLLKSVKFGKDLLLSEMVARVSSLLLGHFASTMSTMNYAIHSVALSITSEVEEFRCALRDYSLVELKKTDKKKEHAHRIFKQTYIYSLLLSIVSAFILVFVMHGKVDIVSASIGTLWYMLPFLVYPIFEIISAYILSTERSEILFYGSFIRLILYASVLGCWSSSGISIPILGILTFAEPIIRMTFFVVVLKYKKRAVKER